MPKARQLGALKKGIDIVIGTPGRIEDLVESRALDLSQVRVAVLDPDRQGPGDPPRPPAGMQSLVARPVLAFEFQLVLTPAAKDPWPALDAAARRVLQPPAKTADPTAEPAKVTPR